jgi:hypothetical protein
MVAPDQLEDLLELVGRIQRLPDPELIYWLVEEREARATTFQILIRHVPMVVQVAEVLVLTITQVLQLIEVQLELKLVRLKCHCYPQLAEDNMDLMEAPLVRVGIQVVVVVLVPQVPILPEQAVQGEPIQF